MRIIPFKVKNVKIFKYSKVPNKRTVMPNEY